MKYKSLALAAGVLLTFHSCAGSPDAYAHIDEDLRGGAYESALVRLDDENGPARKTVYTSKNQILFYLDRGMIRHYAGLYPNSSGDLQEAEWLIEDAFTRSISQEAGSFILNDNVKDYPGEDYEDLYINVFNSLNYYHNDDLEGALVEIRRLNEKLSLLSDKYERAKEKVLDSNKQVDSAQFQVEASKLSNLALARYMGMLFYRGAGRTDSARIDYEEISRAYELAPQVYANSIPRSVDEELAVPDGMARLNVIAFTGLSPVKEAQNIYIPLPLPPPNNMARIATPIMKDRTFSALRAEAVLDTGERFALELIEDMGAVARETFKSKYALIVLKTTARTIVKATTSAIIAGTASAKNENEGLGSLIGLVGRIFTEASEQADTRLSRYFPCYALVGGINLAPGRHEFTVNFYAGNALIFSERREIDIRERALNLEEFVCLK